MCVKLPCELAMEDGHAHCTVWNLKIFAGNLVFTIPSVCIDYRLMCRAPLSVHVCSIEQK
jgi:hypothetical protein